MKEVLLVLTVLAFVAAPGLSAEEVPAAPAYVYVFSYFKKNGQDGFYLAYGEDGLKWQALKDETPFLKPEVGGKLMRDPCIIRGPDGKFHMVWTTSWGDKGIGVAHSEDLVNWSTQQFVPVMAYEPAARNCWAPEITWDAEGRQYVIYWATTIPGCFGAMRTKDFKTWEDISSRLSYPKGMRHGTVLRVSRKVRKELEEG